MNTTSSNTALNAKLLEVDLVQKSSSHLPLADTIKNYMAWAKKNSKYVMKWTILDDRKLLSLDNVYARFRDYNLARSPPLRLADARSNLTNGDIDVAFEYYSKRALKPVLNCDADNKLSDLVGSVNRSEFQWINVNNVLALDKVLTIFDVPHTFQLYFHDIRPHSSFISSTSEFLISLCSLHLDRQTVRLNKLFVFVRGTLCITFELDPAPDFDSTFTSKATIVMAYMARLESGSALESDNPLMLLFELACQNLMWQSSLIYFCSISTYYFRSFLDKRQFEMISGNIDRKVRIIESCLVMLLSLAEDSYASVRKAAANYTYRLRATEGNTIKVINTYNHKSCNLVYFDVSLLIIGP